MGIPPLPWPWRSSSESFSVRERRDQAMNWTKEVPAHLDVRDVTDVHPVLGFRRMTNLRPLLTVDPSVLLLILAEEPKVAAEAISGWRDSGLTARSVRGRKMRNVDALFNEMAAALGLIQ